MATLHFNCSLNLLTLFLFIHLFIHNRCKLIFRCVFILTSQLPLHVSIYLSSCLYIYHSASISTFIYLSMYPSLCMYLSTEGFILHTHLTLLFMYRFDYLLIYLFTECFILHTYLSINLSMYLMISLVYLSIKKR